MEEDNGNIRKRNCQGENSDFGYQYSASDSCGSGLYHTRVNYDILYYLPKEIDTMQGQDILLDEFQKGAYAIVVVDGMHGRELTKLEDKIENVDHVAKLISYNSIVGGDIPLEMIPEKLRSQFYNSDKDSTMLAIFFDDTTSSDGTMNAIRKSVRLQTDSAL